jgi:hypothetical protein
MRLYQTGQWAVICMCLYQTGQWAVTCMRLYQKGQWAVICMCALVNNFVSVFYEYIFWECTCVGSSLASYFVLFSLISFCFRWFRFHFIDFVSFRFCWFRFVSFSLISFIKPIFTITMLDYFPHMSVFHQERTGFDHHWTRILCIYSAGVCPFHLVSSFIDQILSSPDERQTCVGSSLAS